MALINLNASSKSFQIFAALLAKDRCAVTQAVLKSRKAVMVARQSVVNICSL